MLIFKCKMLTPDEAKFSKRGYYATRADFATRDGRISCVDKSASPSIFLFLTDAFVIADVSEVKTGRISNYGFNVGSIPGERMALVIPFAQPSYPHLSKCCPSSVFHSPGLENASESMYVQGATRVER